MEHRYVRGVELPHGLPRARRQAPVRRNGRLEYRDSLYAEYDTAVELDGRLAHLAETKWRDIRRDNAAQVSDVATLRYGWLDVTTRPCEVAAEVAARLATQGYLRARPFSACCPVGRAAEPRLLSARPARTPRSQPSPAAAPAPGRRAAGRSPSGPGRQQAARVTPAAERCRGSRPRPDG